MGENQEHFEQALSRIPSGYTIGRFGGQRWGVTVKRSEDDRRLWLFAEDLHGRDVVSFNYYRMSGGRSKLKPCEMSARKVERFVLHFCPEEEFRS
ncbi:MAG TPA: hypothetical protein VHG11_05290 [Pseudorhizobium sp.]|jgi:hypothetical protein|nr:hypothetical protein [Pseudorhizobium sp.]